MERIVLLGVGSSLSGYNTVLDACVREELRGCELILQGIDEGNLSKLARLADKMNLMDLRIGHTSDISEALEGADFVVMGFEEEGVEGWRKDWEIPYKHGVKQVLGRYGGPGGLFNGLRKITSTMDKAKEIERICPDALLLNNTEPVARTSLALSRYSDLKFVGVSSGVEQQLKLLASVIGTPVSLLTDKSGGLNHFSWYTELRFVDGSDAYPLLSENVAAAKGFQPICRAMYDRFGLYPSTDDAHLGEHLAHAWDLIPQGERGLAWIERCEKENEDNLVWLNDLENLDPDQRWEPSDERVVPIIAGVVSGVEHFEPQVNMPNVGQVSNLIGDAVVESPGRVTGGGVEPVSVGDLPSGLAALCNIQILIQSLVVEAGVRGDRDLALRALLADPVIDDNVQAEEIFKELLEAHRDRLPQFFRDTDGVG